MNVGVVANPNYHDLRSLLERLVAVAPGLGFTLFAEERLLADWPGPRPGVFPSPVALDCLLTFGGDGTILRGARLLAGAPSSGSTWAASGSSLRPRPRTSTGYWTRPPGTPSRSSPASR
jgi:hypothetical protein